MNTLGMAYAAIASLLLIIGYIIYTYLMLRKKNNPNPATWLLWVFIAGYHALTYQVSSGDPVLAWLPFASSVTCIAVFVITYFKGEFSKISNTDYIASAISFISVLVWIYFKEARNANLILQLAIITSFIPTYRSVWKDPKTENWIPWAIWVVSYLFLITAVDLRWEGKWIALVYPINALVLHAIVGLLSVRKQNSKQETEQGLGLVS